MVFALTAAPVAMAEPDLEVYSDSLLNGFWDWHWESLNLSNTVFVHSGLYSISVNPTGYWQGIYFHHRGFDTTPYSSLSFWVHGGTNGGHRLQVQGFLGDVNPAADVYYRFTVPTGGWQQVTIPLAALGIARKTNCTGFWIELTPYGSSNTFYVDDVRFEGDLAGASASASANGARPVSPAPAAEANWSAAVWCIAGALVIVTVLLAWLILMLRRSGMGVSRALIPVSTAAVPQLGLPLAGSSQAVPTAPPGGAEALADPQARQLRERVAWELAEFAKQSLVQGLYWQRGQLAEAQHKAEEELAALEARLAMLQMPLQERIRAYEIRIAELEKELETRDQEMRGMIQATLLLVQDRMEKEKAKQSVETQLN
jgi:hypothetical protein